DRRVGHRPVFGGALLDVLLDRHGAQDLAVVGSGEVLERLHPVAEHEVVVVEDGDVDAAREPEGDVQRRRPVAVIDGNDSDAPARRAGATRWSGLAGAGEGWTVCVSGSAPGAAARAVRLTVGAAGSGLVRVRKGVRAGGPGEVNGKRQVMKRKCPLNGRVKQ